MRARATRRLVLVMVLGLLGVGCSDPTAPGEGCGTEVVRTFTLVEDSLGIHETATYDTVPVLCGEGF